MTNIEDLVMETFQKVSELEEQLQEMEQQQTDEEAILQHKYDILKAPVYQKRNEVVSKIPSFWRTALLNHSMFTNIITEEDEEILDTLQSMSVTRDPSDHRVFKVSLIFNPTLGNTFFENTEISKELRSNTDGSISVKDTPILWKSSVSGGAGGDAGKKRKSMEPSFIGLFQDDSEDAIEIINVLITDFYPNVISYYQGISDEEDEEYEDEEDIEGESE